MEEAGPAAADWMRELWTLLLKENYAHMPDALRAVEAALPRDEAFALARQWLDVADDRGQSAKRLNSFSYLRNPLTIPLIEEWWKQSDPKTPVTGDWGTLAAASLVDWPTLRRWLEAGRPLGLVALAALQEYSSKGLPSQYSKPERAEFQSVLADYRSRDRAPRASKSVDHLLAAMDQLTVSPV